MSLKGLTAIFILCLMIGSLVIISDPTEACFTWEVTCDDTANGVDEGEYTTYEIEISLRPGCRSTYWLTFTTQGEPTGWSSAILNMSGGIIPYGKEFFLSGTVVYIFTLKVIPPETVNSKQTAVITTTIRANDKYNQNETIDVITTSTINYPEDRTPQAVDLWENENTTSSIELLWSASDDINFDRYEIHMCLFYDFTPVPSTLVDTVEQSSTVLFNVTGLSAGSTYYFIVQVWDSDAPAIGGPYFADSITLVAHTPGVNYPPEAVFLGPPTDISNRSVRLSWSLNADTDFECYEVHFSETEGFVIGDTMVVDPIYDQQTGETPVPGLPENRTLYFKVRVRDAGGMANDSNEVSCKTKDYDPNPVILYEPHTTTVTSTKLNWSNSHDSDFFKYEVHKSETSGFSPDSTTLYQTITDTLENYTTVVGLLEKTTYYFKVRVYDEAGHHNDSVEVSTTTLDETAPEIILHVPANDALDVDITQDIVITFDEEMDTGTLTYTCTPDPGGWSPAWDANNEVVTLSHDDLEDDIEHTFVVTAASDVSGNAMAASYEFAFTTQDLTPPEILSTNPEDDAEDVYVTADISFTFTEPMDKTSVENAITKTFQCSFSWNGNTITLSPTSDLSPSKSYTVTVGTDAMDEAGNHLTSSFVLNFKTETEDVNHAPTVSVSSPSSDIADESFEIRWSASDSDGDTISITLYYDTDKNSNNGMTLIGGSLGNSGSYVWDISDMEEGNYFVYVLASDGEFEEGAYSGLLTIDHQDVEEPDNDSDGIPDATDTDDDNDGIPDTLEDLDGDGQLDSGETDPMDPDTDGDGFDDGMDEFPRDPMRWETEPEGGDDGGSSLPMIFIVIIIVAVLVGVIIAAWAAMSGKKGGVSLGTINCPNCGGAFAPNPQNLPYVQCPHCGTQGRM